MLVSLLLCLVVVTTTISAQGSASLVCYLCLNDETQGIIDRSCLAGTNMTTTTDYVDGSLYNLSTPNSAARSDIYDAAEKVARKELKDKEVVEQGDSFYCISWGVTLSSTQQTIFVRLKVSTKDQFGSGGCFDVSYEMDKAKLCFCSVDKCNKTPYGDAGGSGDGGDGGSTEGTQSVRSNPASLLVGILFGLGLAAGNLSLFVSKV